MTCGKCGNPLKDPQLACHVCLLRNWRATAWNAIRTGALPMRIGESHRHFSLLHDTETLCGKPEQCLGAKDCRSLSIDIPQSMVKLTCLECAQQIKQNAPEIWAAAQLLIEQATRTERGKIRSSAA